MDNEKYNFMVEDTRCRNGEGIYLFDLLEVNRKRIKNASILVYEKEKEYLAFEESTFMYNVLLLRLENEMSYIIENLYNGYIAYSYNTIHDTNTDDFIYFSSTVLYTLEFNTDYINKIMNKIKNTILNNKLGIDI